MEKRDIRLKKNPKIKFINILKVYLHAKLQTINITENVNYDAGNLKQYI